MEATVEHGEGRRTLPTILIAAVLQGWALYALHMSIEHQAWPATAPAWLFACYALAAFVPVMVQLLAQHMRNPTAWILVSIIGVVFFYFGWHHGSQFGERDVERFIDDQMFPLGFVLLVLSTLLVPFVQCRLAAGAWRFAYRDLFATTWRDIILLAEALAFTGLFWLLLFLWQQLFHMLGVDFFRELFQEPVFIYPVTSVCFGVALHLIGSVDRLTSVVLEQVLSVLKWLAVVAGLILGLFTVALVLKLPSLVTEGARAIGAAWLLWLVAVMVLLVNAAYRDGSVERPYPRLIAVALRFVMPLLVIVALTACYSLYLRVDEYGLTVSRVWAFIVAATALAYSVGYAVAAVRGKAWLDGVSRVNVAVSLGLIAIIALALTPVLSPYRLAANSQYKLALRLPEVKDTRGGPFHYLRFEAGRYGLSRLQALAQLEEGDRAADIREAAESALARTERWGLAPALNVERSIEQLAIYPQGRQLEPALRDEIIASAKQPGCSWARSDCGLQPEKAVGLFVDLNSDGAEEFVIVSGVRAHAYRREDTTWKTLGMALSGHNERDAAQTSSVEQGDVSVERAQWGNLRIGSSLYTFSQLPAQ